MKERIISTLQAIIKRSIDLDAAPDSVLRADLNMDSLDLVEFGVNVEQELNGIDIPDEDLHKFHDMSVEEIADYLVERFK